MRRDSSYIARMDALGGGHDDATRAAARALAAYDPLAALRYVALRHDARALALRGIAMAQLGDYRPARRLLARAARAFHRTDRATRARCLAAQGEIALAERDLGVAQRTLGLAVAALEAEGDLVNATFVRLQQVRCLLWLGQIEKAASALSRLELDRAPDRFRAIAALISAEIATRTLQAARAQSALAKALRAATRSRIASLVAEVERQKTELASPVGRLVREGVDQWATLADVEHLLRSDDLVVDACRRQVSVRQKVVDLVSRPVLMSLAVALALAAPAEVTREALIEHAFGVRRSTDSLRARLRVELGRLRTVLASFADIEAMGGGYALLARRGKVVTVLLPPAAGEESAVLALLRGGESWSTSALAAALGTSQRAVQRALVALGDSSRVEAVGKGRSRRWIAAPPRGFASTLLLVTRPAAE
jgi:tetratricopeptide (TPR) repeat protein